LDRDGGALGKMLPTFKVFAVRAFPNHRVPPS
jgi:hypothetical protein